MQALEPGDPRSVETSGRAYRILARLGSGGMGTVYLGRSAAGRAVAIKVVHADLAADPAFRERFRREAELSGTVGGGFTAPVIDADPDAPLPWLATEYLPSMPLGDAVRSHGALQPEVVRHLAAGVAEALIEIHGAGIVHRDLTPANVLLTRDGPRVIDFGIARALDAATITHSEAPPGSPGFMSPEQAAGETVGPPGDVFTLGATLMFACTGKEPFGTGTWHEQLLRLQSERPRLDRVPDEDLRALIADCMEREPARRPTAAQIADRLGDRPSGLITWPSAIAAEIDRRAQEAASPPVPTGRRGGNLPIAAAVAAALAVVIGVSAATWLQARDSGAEPVAASAAPSATVPATTASPTPAGRLRLTATGDAEVESLTYTVNGESTTVENVELPWEVTVPIPGDVPRTVYELEVKTVGGAVSCRAYVNGRPGPLTSIGGGGTASVGGTI